MNGKHAVTNSGTQLKIYNRALEYQKVCIRTCHYLWKLENILGDIIKMHSC